MVTKLQGIIGTIDKQGVDKCTRRGTRKTPYFSLILNILLDKLQKTELDKWFFSSKNHPQALPFGIFEEIFKPMIMSKKIIFDYADAPFHFAICLASNCPKAENCLRSLAAQAQMEEREQLEVVNPKRIRPEEGTGCPYYQDATPIRVAYGFKKALGSIRADRVGAAINSLMGLNSRRTYYRLLNGEIPLKDPLKQQVANILLRYGAEKPIQFDRYEEELPW